MSRAKWPVVSAEDTKSPAPGFYLRKNSDNVESRITRRMKTGCMDMIRLVGKRSYVMLSRRTGSQCTVVNACRVTARTQQDVVLIWCQWFYRRKTGSDTQGLYARNARRCSATETDQFGAWRSSRRKDAKEVDCSIRFEDDGTKLFTSGYSMGCSAFKDMTKVCRIRRWRHVTVNEESYWYMMGSIKWWIELTLHRTWKSFIFYVGDKNFINQFFLQEIPAIIIGILQNTSRISLKRQ